MLECQITISLLHSFHFATTTADNSTSPQTNIQQPSTGDNNEDANDTFHSCGGETIPPHRNLSLIETVSTEEPELNSSVGPLQSTPVQVTERKKTSPVLCKFLVVTKTRWKIFCSLKHLAS